MSNLNFNELEDAAGVRFPTPARLLIKLAVSQFLAFRGERQPPLSETAWGKEQQDFNRSIKRSATALLNDVDQLVKEAGLSKAEWHDVGLYPSELRQSLEYLLRYAEDSNRFLTGPRTGPEMRVRVRPASERGGKPKGPRTLLLEKLYSLYCAAGGKQKGAAYYHEHRGRYVGPFFEFASCLLSQLDLPQDELLGLDEACKRVARAARS